jgi:hypothetical protein
MRGIPFEELPAAFAKARKMPRAEGWEVLNQLGSRWAESDPKGAMAFGIQAGSFGQPGGSNPFLEGAAEKWLESAPADALAWIEALPPGTVRSSLIPKTILSVDRTDPQRALQVLQRNTFTLGGPWAAENLFNDWTARDPESAAAAALQLKGDVGRSARKSVARSWAQDNPAKAMAWAASVPNIATRKELITSIAKQWAQSDPRAEIAWALPLNDANMRLQSLRAGMSQLAAADLPAALDLIHAMPSGDDHDQALLTVVNKAGEKDARGALRLLDDLPPGADRNSAGRKLCETWGQTDPRGALDWLVQNVPPPRYNPRIYSGNAGLTGLVQRWVASSPEDAIAWAQALPEGDNRSAALASVVEGLSSTDLSRAQSIFNQLPPDAQETAAGVLAANLTIQDADQARAWVESLPEGPAQDSGLRVVATKWANQNPTAVASWLDTLAPGNGRDSAVVGYSWAVFQSNPKSALSLVMTIADAKNRDEQTESLVGRWLNSDSNAARNWLQANQQITAEEKDRILSD